MFCFRRFVQLFIPFFLVFHRGPEVMGTSVLNFSKEMLGMVAIILPLASLQET